MTEQDEIFIFEEETEQFLPKPCVLKRLFKRFFRKPFTLRFLRGLDLGEQTEQFQADIDFTKRLYITSPFVCTNLLVGVAARQLNGIQQTVLLHNLLIYERVHLKRQSVDDHLVFLLGLDDLSEYLGEKHP